MTAPLRHLMLAIVVLAATILPASLAMAAPAEAPKLGIAPVDYDGPWFDLELRPGATAELTVELANHGDIPTVVHTFAAATSTLVNGGMDVALDSQDGAGTVAWIDYPDSTFDLPPDGAVTRTFTVTVPADAAAGEYLAAVVIENDQPFTEDRGDLALEHVVRQALAVNVTVPGPTSAALTVGKSQHNIVGDRSVIAFELHNPGNRHVKPTGTVTVSDADGRQVAEHDIALDSIYAGTSTRLEYPLDRTLGVGIYTATVSLADPTHDITAEGTDTFEIAPPTPAERSLLPGVDRILERLPDGTPAWVPAAAALAMAVLAAVAFLLGRRRRSVRIEPVPPAVAPVTPHPAAPAMTTPDVRSSTVIGPPSETAQPTAAIGQHVPASGAVAVAHRPRPAVATPSAAPLDPANFTARPPRRRRRR